MIVKKFSKKSELYCANLTNYFSSVERNKSNVKHKMLVHEIISDKKKKPSVNLNIGSHSNHLTHYSVDINVRKKTSLLNFFKESKNYKEFKLKEENNKIMKNLSSIKNRRSVFFILFRQRIMIVWRLKRS